MYQITSKNMPRTIFISYGHGDMARTLGTAFTAPVHSTSFKPSNDPERPLEALRPAKQSEVINRLAQQLDEYLRDHILNSPAAPESSSNLFRAFTEIARQLQVTEGILGAVPTAQ